MDDGAERGGRRRASPPIVWVSSKLWWVWVMLGETWVMLQRIRVMLECIWVLLDVVVKPLSGIRLRPVPSTPGVVFVGGESGGACRGKGGAGRV